MVIGTGQQGYIREAIDCLEEALNELNSEDDRIAWDNLHRALDLLGKALREGKSIFQVVDDE